MSNLSISGERLPRDSRCTGPFRSKKEARRYRALLSMFLVLGFAAALGLLIYDNPVLISSSSFLPVVRRRMYAVGAMMLAAICQSLSTVTFQSITNNRVITPSLLGFEALYTAIHTASMFFLGVRGVTAFTGTGAFLIQVAVMVAMCLVLFGWLLSGKYGNLQLMLLIGVIMGTGLRSLSSFMRRLLSPSEFDLLQARLLGSVNNASIEYFPIAIPLVVIAALLIFAHAKKLNVASLGGDTATALGVRQRSGVIYPLILVSVLMSVSTSLVGPLTFYGFLVAALSYQAAPTYDHRRIFPMALAIAFLVITGAYFFMYHVFSAQGVVSVIIEMFGGLAFLAMIIKKGAL